ncbi:MAG: phage tail sheath family protein [Bacteriovoracaceae bacterium]|nr:phage tail sheath family protein [Bacteriovoracaceae bacterium]
MKMLFISLLVTFSFLGCNSEEKLVQATYPNPDRSLPPSNVGVYMGAVAFVDTYPQGPLDGAVRVLSLNDFESIFIGNSSSRYEHRLAHIQMKKFFENGGQEALVTRVEIPEGRELQADDVISRFHNLRGVTHYATLVLPVLANLRESEATRVRSHALDLVKERDSFLLIDPKHEGQMSFEDVIKWRDEAQDLTEARSYAAVYFGRLFVVDESIGIQGMYIDPTPSVAGIFSNTSQYPEWKPPGNIELKGFEGLEYHLTDEEMAELNAPINGLSICSIRSLPNRGPVVWGIRTLDGNSYDFRYINSRRNVSMVRKSFQDLLDHEFIFYPNTQSTWESIKTSFSIFLESRWSMGALAGGSIQESFKVEVGLGETMSEQDIIDGYIKVRVSLQLASINPGEFIELDLSLKLPGAK